MVSAIQGLVSASASGAASRDGRVGCGLARRKGHVRQGDDRLGITGGLRGGRFTTGTPDSRSWRW